MWTGLCTPLIRIYGRFLGRKGAKNKQQWTPTRVKYFNFATHGFHCTMFEVMLTTDDPENNKIVVQLSNS